MPPYAGNFTFASSSDNVYANAAPTKPEAAASTDDSSAAEGSQKSGHFEALLDFNPCTTMSGAGHSMSSAMFKVRNCSWCGKGCNKIKGYRKEVIEGTSVNEETGEEEPADQKIYYHKWCFQLKEWKVVHSEGWKTVMHGLIGHFRAIELAEQRRREAEERARQEALRRAEEARRRAEEARKVAEQQRREEAEKRRQEEERLAAEKAVQEAAEKAAEEARLKREKSLTYKVGKKLSAFKIAVTAPCKNKKAVDEQATEEKEQHPNYDL